jgi:phosphatidylcholine synthase
MSQTSPWQRAAAWAVHLYTASGSVLAVLIVVAAFQGEAVRALWLGLAALVVDGTDGMLARRLRVRDRLPWFDGARLDDIVDYLTYAFAPMLLLWSGDHLPDGTVGAVALAAPLLASCFQFCRVDAKTQDHLFLGFPSYWNVIAFYAIVMDLGPALVATVLLACAVLAFVPIGYVYPSRTVSFRTPTLALTAAWLVAYAVILVQMPDPHPLWVALSLAYVVYYVALSVHLTARRARSARAGSDRDPAPVTQPAVAGAGTEQPRC